MLHRTSFLLASLLVFAGCRQESPSSPDVVRRPDGIVVLGCQTPNPGAGTLQAAIVPVSPLSPTAVSGTEKILASISQAPLKFARYDLASGMSYSYGFTVYDYDCDGTQDVSYFDSWVKSRELFRPQRGVIGGLKLGNGKTWTIVDNDDFDYLPAEFPGGHLFERHLPLDVNNDGYMDIVGVVNSHAAVVAYLNAVPRQASRANLPSWRPTVLTSQLPGVVNLTASDVDNDGDQDLVLAMRKQLSTSSQGIAHGLAWLENNGDSHDWPMHPIDLSDVFLDARTVQAGDIDQDGRVDVLTTDPATGKAAWYAQVAYNTWIRHELPAPPTYAAHFAKLLDFDGDGSLDVLLPHFRGVSWLRNTGRGDSWQLYPIATFVDDTWQTFVTEVETGDIDLDGLLDVVFTLGTFSDSASAPRTGGLMIARRDGLEWRLQRIYMDENAAVGVQLHDYDGDGDLDIFTNTEYQQNGVTLWQNLLPHQ